MADSFDQAFAELGVDPAWASGGSGGGMNYPGGSPTFQERQDSGQAQPWQGGSSAPYLGSGQTPWGGQAEPPPAAPQAGQWSANNQGFLDWATKKFGADRNSFVKIPPGQLQAITQQYTAETGNPAKFVGGPSGDQVDFGQGVRDALTSSGQIWRNESQDTGTPSGGGGGGGGSPQAWSSGGGTPGYGGGGPAAGGGPPAGSMTMPTAPTAKDLTAPDPFTYQPSQLGNFSAPSQVPTMERLGYNPAANAPTLSYQNMATPKDYQAEKYTGLTAEQLAADPSYKFRFEQGQKATENALAHAGALRTGNAVQALTDYGQGAASQEYAAADARARQTNAMNNATSLGAHQTNAQTGLAYGQANNQNALNFGNTNFQNQFAVNQANNQGSNAAIQGNNANALAAQQAQFGQAATGYGLNQQANQQAYQQALGAYGQNAQTQLAYGSQNQNNSLSRYQAEVNAALGLGNLNLGFQNSAQNYSLGQGGLGIQQGNLDLNRAGQQYNQDLSTYQTNYQNQVLTPWQQNYQLASLGNPGAPNTSNYANQGSDLITGAGNANAASQIAQGNASAAAYQNLGNMAASAGNYYQQGRGGGQLPGPYQPGYGQPLYQ